ncbi:MAG: outer membrane lipoprotein chaperone LolA [Gammaproteobacteria bacterium]
MSRLACTGLAVLVLIGIGEASLAAVPGEDDDLRLLRDYLDGLATLTADFRQQIVDRELEPLDDARGRVVLKKPGRFRWDYTEPYERVISADGERLWLYEADLEQVTIRRLDAGLGATPAALLTGSADVLDHFEYRGGAIDGDIRWLRLEPRSAESDFTGVELGFVEDELQRIFLTDRLGQRTQIYLSHIDSAATVTDEFFRFEVPDGVDVIDADAL